MANSLRRDFGELMLARLRDPASSLPACARSSDELQVAGLHEAGPSPEQSRVYAATSFRHLHCSSWAAQLAPTTANQSRDWDAKPWTPRARGRQATEARGLSVTGGSS